MGRSLWISIGFHIVLLLLMIFGLPFMNHRSLEAPQPIPVEVLPISDETMALKPTLKPKPVEPEKKPEPPKEEVQSNPEPETKPNEPEPTPEPPKPELKPELKPEIKPEKKVEEKPKEEEKPTPPKPKEKPKDKPKPTNDMSSILKNLEQKKNSRKNEDKESKETDSSPDEQQVGKLGDRLTMSEMDAIRQQISKCWNIPAGAKEAKDLVVEVKVKMSPDGSVREVKIVNRRPAPGTELIYKSAQESARRAVIQCSPLKLPANKYDVWKEFSLTFSPKDIL